MTKASGHHAPQREPGEAWNTPALDEFAAQLQRLAQHENEQARRPRRRRRQMAGLTLAACAAAALILAVGPLRHADTADAGGLSHALAAAQRAGTLTFHTTIVRVTAGQHGQTIDVDGALDFRHDRYRLTTQPQGGGQGLELRVMRGAWYARAIGAPQSSRVARWNGTHFAGQPLSISAHTGPSDPLGLLAILSAHPKATLLGELRMHGIPVTDYRLHSTLAMFLPAHASTSTRRLASHVPAAIQAWVNRDGQVIRAEREFELPGPDPEKLTITTELENYGSPLAITRPAAAPLHGHMNPSDTSDPLTREVAELLTLHGAPTTHHP